MTPLEIVLLIAMALCAITLTMTVINLGVYRRPLSSPRMAGGGVRITVCVPARNEEANLEACVRSILASTERDIEVLVYDDQSTDNTPTILAKLIASDPRVRAAQVTPLPAGWNGKQHACWRMSEQATRSESGGQWLCFTDADVRFEPNCLADALAFAQSQKADMVSTFPRQITGSLAERLAVPMIFFILFSYLPMPRMRTTRDPAASAACGQFILVSRNAYEKAGGHEAFKNSMHDGVKMPREVRKAGFHTDLFDGTHLVSVRMYRGLAQTWRGFAKNAFEGLGSVGLLMFITVVHLLAHVLPWIIVPWALLGRLAPSTFASPTDLAALFAVSCVAMAVLQRFLLARRFQQGLTPVLLHPLGVLMMTMIQWHSLYLSLTGKRAWRGRVATV
jgi:glycosyltransferase involved in cell wall biosynthesis